MNKRQTGKVTWAKEDPKPVNRYLRVEYEALESLGQTKSGTWETCVFYITKPRMQVTHL